MEQELIDAGFEKDIIAWSFKPKLNNDYYWCKYIDYEGGHTNLIEVGVILNEEHHSMEVYACDCVVGCCGRDMGIHPFSIEKINELIQEEIKYLDEIYGRQ